ncbi:MAG TPA: GNAT family N-acetyltransferase [Solirubrobacteraceae bacterium]|nr:GNAT family N-acetyltransferase [Solirubrobacteraceae bacterium]
MVEPVVHHRRGVIVQTPRLLLRPWRPEADLDPLAALCADPEVMRHIGTGRTLTGPEAGALLAAIVRHWEAHGYGLWAVEVKQHAGGRPGEAVGFAGLAIPSFLPAVLPAVECGWRLARGWWGRGLATEAGRASVAWGWERLGLQRLLAIVAPGNDRSVRVAEKLGMHRGRDRVHPVTRRRLWVYELERPA